MPFPSPVSAGNKTKMRASGYWNRAMVLLCQNTVIFACRANESITDDPFAEFDYDGVTVGAFGDVMPGMVFYISSTNDIRAAKYRGRVRKALTGSTFYCDENATVLNDGDYIFVVRDVDLFAKVRRGDLMDYDIAYHNLEPQISGLPHVEVLYDANDDGVVSFAPAQSGIAVASGASISSWLWTISGDGTATYTTGSSTSQNPVIQLQAGFEYLIRCRVTDSNSIQHFQFIRVYALDFDCDTLVVNMIVGGDVSHNIDSGFNANVTAYADVSTILDRTFAVIFRIEHFGTGNEDSVFTNVLMCGRFRSENDSTAGDPEVGRTKQTTFPVEGIASYMKRLRVPNDIVRASAAPNEWGEMVEPTLYRAVCYLAGNYSTLTNLCSFSAGSSLFAAWELGGEPVSLDGNLLFDTINAMMDRIKASMNFAPTGEIYMQQIASYQADRSAIQTIMTFDESEGDYRSFDLNRDASDTVAQVVAYGGMFDSTANAFILFTAQAPTIIYGDATETTEINRELLQADSSTDDAIDELNLRAANHFAFVNPKPMLSVLFKSAFAGILIASLYQRWVHIIAASANTRGIAYGASDYWQLQSVNIGINPDGTLEPSGEFIAETSFEDAQSIASQLPDNATPPNPVTPVLSDYPHEGDNPLWSFPTDTPTADELQPIDPYSGYVAYSPFPPDQAAEAGRNQGTTRCKTFQVLARNSGTTNSPFLTVNTAPYTLEISGSGQIDTDWSHLLDAGDFPGMAAFVSSLGQITGSNITPTHPGAPSDGSIVRITFAAPVSLTGIEITQTGGSGIVGSPVINRFYAYYSDSPPTVQVHNASLPIQNGAWTVDDDTAVSGVRTVEVHYVFTNPALAFTHTILLRGLSTNPFTGVPGVPVSADWFYFWPTGDDSIVQLFPATAGGLIDGNKPAVIPPFNEAHEYSIPFTGTGNAIQAAYALSSYTNVQNFAFTIQACRNP